MAFKEFIVKTANVFTQSGTEFLGDIARLAHHSRFVLKKVKIFLVRVPHDMNFNKIPRLENSLFSCCLLKNELCILQLPTTKHSHLGDIKSQSIIGLIHT